MKKIEEGWSKLLIEKFSHTIMVFSALLYFYLKTFLEYYISTLPLMGQDYVGWLRAHLQKMSDSGMWSRMGAECVLAVGSGLLHKLSSKIANLYPTEKWCRFCQKSFGAIRSSLTKSDNTMRRH